MKNTIIHGCSSFDTDELESEYYVEIFFPLEFVIRAELCILSYKVHELLLFNSVVLLVQGLM